MKAQVDDVQFGDGKLIVEVGYYYTKGEEGYVEYFEEVEEEEVGNVGMKQKILLALKIKKAEEPPKPPPQIPYFKPFFTISYNIDYNGTLESLRVPVRGQLSAFKAAHSHLPEFQEWTGEELAVI